MSDIIEFPRRGVYARYCISPGQVGPMVPRYRQDAGNKERNAFVGTPAPLTLAEHAARQSATVIRLMPSKSSPA
jgi:hypothetical protein